MYIYIYIYICVCITHNDWFLHAKAGLSPYTCTVLAHSHDDCLLHNHPVIAQCICVLLIMTEFFMPKQDFRHIHVYVYYSWWLTYACPTRTCTMYMCITHNKCFLVPYTCICASLIMTAFCMRKQFLRQIHVFVHHSWWLPSACPEVLAKCICIRVSLMMTAFCMPK